MCSKRFPEVAQPVRHSHDVGMHHQRHDPRGAVRVGVQLLELIDGAVPVFRGFVMLNQHHRDVVAFLRVRHAHEGTAARVQHNRLVVQNPVADVIVAFFGQDVGRVPCLGQARPKPAARPSPVKARMASVVLAISARSSGTFCMFFWPKPWPTNSHPRSCAARAIGS